MKYSNLNLGQIEALVNRLGGMKIVDRILSTSTIKVELTHTIDCSVEPFKNFSFKIEEHKSLGSVKLRFNDKDLYLNGRQIGLFIFKNQQKGAILKGVELRKLLLNKDILNANVLEYLLNHPYLIPEWWKGKNVFFWGTIFQGVCGDLFVRCLYWKDDHWDWAHKSLCEDFHDDYYAMLENNHPNFDS